MMRGKNVKKIAVLLLVAVFWGGCAEKKPVEVPELLEYAFGGENYRPVDTRYYGNYNTYAGTIKAKEYCSFFTSSVNIKEINVVVGDYVEKGDIVATIDVNGMEEEIADLKNRRVLLQKQHEIDEEIYILQHEQLELKTAGANSLKSWDEAKDCLKSIEVLEEDKHYEDERYENEIAFLSREIEEKTKLYQDGLLRAEATGYVIFTKDLTLSSNAQIGENIVVISDYEQKEIELAYVQATTKNQRALSKMKCCYTEIGGKKYPLTLRNYSLNEIVNMESYDAYPNVIMEIEDTSVLPEVGSVIPVYCRENEADKSISISFDSLEKDDEGYYVYVKEGDAKVCRRVEVGRRTKYFVEITDGLSSEDIVYYTNNRMHFQYDNKIELQPEDYPEYGTDKTYGVKKDLAGVMYSEQEGKVLEVFKQKGDNVEKGEVLYTIQTESKASSLKTCSDSIAELIENEELSKVLYEKNVENLRKAIISAVQMENLKKQLEEDEKKRQEEEEKRLLEAAEAGEEIPTVSGNDYPSSEELMINPYLSQELERSIKELEANRRKEVLQYEYDLQVLKNAYNRMKKNNNGTGIIKVCAIESGELKEATVYEGKNIKYGEKTFTIISNEKRHLIVYSSSELYPNQKLTMISRLNQKEYNGTIIGSLSNNRVYMCTKNDKKYLTRVGKVSPGAYQYVVEMEDESFYDSEELFDVRYVANTIFGGYGIPYYEVFSEIIETDMYEYVWIDTGDMMVKKYIEISEIHNDAPKQVCLKSGQKDKVCVVNGLNPGDCIATERK